MRNLSIIIIFMIINVFHCFGQKENIERIPIKNSQLIPFIKYNPMDFEHEINTAFQFNKMKSCMFVKKNKDSKEFYLYSDFTTNGIFHIDKVELQLSPLQREIISTHDSIFFFNPKPNMYMFVPNNIRFIGYKEKDKICFVDKDNIYSLETLLINEYGSIRNFITIYIDCMNAAFGKRESGLYGFGDENDAVSFLRSNYKFCAINGLDDDKITSLFMELLEKNIRIAPSQKQKLSDLLLKNKNEKGQMVADFLAGRSFQVFDMLFLRAIFTREEQKLIETIILEDDIKLQNAYYLIGSKIPNTDEEGRYYRDIDFLDFVSKKVYNK